MALGLPHQSTNSLLLNPWPIEVLAELKNCDFPVFMGSHPSSRRVPHQSSPLETGADRHWKLALAEAEAYAQGAKLLRWDLPDRQG